MLAVCQGQAEALLFPSPVLVHQAQEAALRVTHLFRHSTSHPKLPQHQRLESVPSSGSQAVLMVFPIPKDMVLGFSSSSWVGSLLWLLQSCSLLSRVLLQIQHELWHRGAPSHQRHRGAADCFQSNPPQTGREVLRGCVLTCVPSKGLRVTVTPRVISMHINFST